MLNKPIFNFILLILGFVACDGTDSKLKVANNAPYPIAIFVNFQYPDTSFALAWTMDYIPAKDTGGVHVMHDSWDGILAKTKFVTIFFVREDSASKYSINERTMLHPLKTITLTQSELEALNWTIDYP